MLVAKKASNMPAKYIFSIDSNNITRSARGYLGTLTSNLFGSFYNLHDHVCAANAEEKDLGRNILAVNFVLSSITLGLWVV